MLILVRHGRTAANAKALLQGRVDHPLDDVGQDQARRVARVINELYPGARVVSSPLRRARMTADAISQQVVIDERFIELDYGAFDELALTDVPAETWAQWRADPHFRPPNGETLAELDVRVHAALDELTDEATTKDIVVVAHVSPIKSAVVWALNGHTNMSWRCALDRGSITRIAIGPRGPSLVGFNDTAHLDVK